MACHVELGKSIITLHCSQNPSSFKRPLLYFVKVTHPDGVIRHELAHPSTSKVRYLSLVVTINQRIPRRQILVRRSCMCVCSFKALLCAHYSVLNRLGLCSVEQPPFLFWLSSMIGTNRVHSTNPAVMSADAMLEATAQIREGNKHGY